MAGPLVKSGSRAVVVMARLSMAMSARPVSVVRLLKAKRSVAAGMKPGVARFSQMTALFHEMSRPWESHVMVTGRKVTGPAEESSMRKAEGKSEALKSPMRVPLA